MFVENHRVIGLDPADPISIDKTKGPHGTMIGGEKAKAAAQKYLKPDAFVVSIVKPEK